MSDLSFYVDSIKQASDEGDVETAVEYREGLLRHLAWQYDPKTVATIDELIKPYEAEL